MGVADEYENGGGAVSRNFFISLREFCVSVGAGGILLFASPAWAVDASDLILGKFDSSSRKQRTAIANDLLKNVQELSQYLPIQKPQEIEWTKQESNAIAKLRKSEIAGANLRSVKLVESPEWQHEKLQSALTEIRDALLCASNQSISISREMMCWSVASFHLSDHNKFNDAVRILLSAGRLPEDALKKARIASESLGYGFFYHLYGRGILEYVIIPYLKSQVK